jgi:hypothetical protein
MGHWVATINMSVWPGFSFAPKANERKIPDGERSKAERYREDARRLRAIARELRFDLRRRYQLLALADGFDDLQPASISMLW